MRRVLCGAAGLGLVAVGAHTFAARGPSSARARFGRHLAELSGRSGDDAPVTDDDLAGLPALVAEHVRRSGAVGQPRLHNFRATVHGRIRGGVDEPWMDFTGEQFNTYGTRHDRVLFMRARMSGLPVDVLHAFVGDRATMRGRLCSLVPVVNAAGADMDRAETVTVFNDLCVLAPGALVDAPVVWEAIDGRRVRGSYTRGAQTVSAELTFDDDGDLIDFVSDDRLRASSGGSTFEAQRWSTPVHDQRSFGTRRVATFGEGRWHAPDPEGEFAYIEFHVDAITYNVSDVHARPPGRRRQWGATPAEASAVLPGDEIIADPSLVTTRAVTIDAPPESVWPWLVQMGQGRGGFYSYDRLERLFGLDIHNADRIVPEWQRLAVGDAIRMAPPKSGPDASFTVAAIEPFRSIVTIAGDPARVLPAAAAGPLVDGATWTFVLQPIDRHMTRLIVRLRARFGLPSVAEWACTRLLGPGHFVMERKQLLEIRRHAQDSVRG